ncbi:uncharacterized protein VTP21DRAFT_6434 [Calcarisporiella thermophila]|uniref:uncharacterized protein n=1 Tax=Calcarisporiella thermophila TaxID=911321 RepID=UPI003744831F
MEGRQLSYTEAERMRAMGTSAASSSVNHTQAWSQRLNNRRMPPRSYGANIRPEHSNYAPLSGGVMKRYPAYDTHPSRHFPHPPPPPHHAPKDPYIPPLSPNSQQPMPMMRPQHPPIGRTFSPQVEKMPGIYHQTRNRASSDIVYFDRAELSSHPMPESSNFAENHPSLKKHPPVEKPLPSPMAAGRTHYDTNFPLSDDMRGQMGRARAPSQSSQRSLPITPQEIVRSNSNARTPLIDPSATRPTEVQAIIHKPPMQEEKEEESEVEVPESITKMPPPNIYPALLSRVAMAFKERISLNTRVKDSIEYKDCFDGRETVDLLAHIIRTSDRNLALLVGCALESQKLFHDVTYDHRLRDSPHELYRFRECIPLMSPAEASETFSPGSDSPPISPTSSHAYFGRRDVLGVAPPDEEDAVPTGVFTLLTRCYSPTCTKDRLCYSLACPRRLEQQARLLLTSSGGLSRTTTKDSSQELHDDSERLWINSVPKEVADSVSSDERKRQDVIYELIYTEKDFVSDLEYVYNNWIVPLRTSSVIPEQRREKFIQDVFYNMMEVHSVNSQMSAALQKRQQAYAIVDQIGDILAEYTALFEPFVTYGAHQIVSRFVFEKEKSLNPQFAEFVTEVERKPESRKLELNGYLTKPTTRLGRYNLLLERIAKYTPEGHPDKVMIPQTMEVISGFLKRVNIEAGKTENRFNLEQLHENISFKSGMEYNLRLLDEGRELIMKGTFSRKGSSSDQSSEITVFLFDHMILFTKVKYMGKLEHHKVTKSPIPIDLLQINLPDQPQGRRPNSFIFYGQTDAPALNSSSSSASIAPPLKLEASPKQGGHPITFIHIGGKGGSPLTLYASSLRVRQHWVEKIEKQRLKVFEQSQIFSINTLSEKHFTMGDKVHCSATFDNGRKIVYGTDAGLSISLVDKPNTVRRVLSIERVSQIEILEEARIVLVLADKNLYSYSIDALDPNTDQNVASKKGRRIGTHISFFKAGVCLDRTLICIVKTNTLSSTIKTLEPHYQPASKTKKFLRRNNDTLRVYKEFYIPTESTSIHFLKTKLCVGCIKGFEIVDLETLNTQGLLDPSDASLDFVLRRENVRPVAIYRVRTGEFLLCYNEFAFFVDKVGRRARPDWLITWEGSPTTFAFCYPYVLAFEPSFIEVRNVISGEREQVIQGAGLRCLNPGVFSEGAPEGKLGWSKGVGKGKDYGGMIHCAMDDVRGGEYQFLFSLNLANPSVAYYRPEKPAPPVEKGSSLRSQPSNASGATLAPSPANGLSRHAPLRPHSTSNPPLPTAPHHHSIYPLPPQRQHRSPERNPPSSARYPSPHSSRIPTLEGLTCSQGTQKSPAGTRHTTPRRSSIQRTRPITRSPRNNFLNHHTIPIRQ